MCVSGEGGDRAMQGVGWWMALLSLDTKSGSSNHSSIFAWKIPQTEESGGLLAMRLQRV